MKSAKLKTSPRLQRVNQLLADGREYSTQEICALANVCAVNSIVSELRDNGRTIHCRREGGGDQSRWYYRMEQAA